MLLVIALLVLTISNCSTTDFVPQKEADASTMTVASLNIHYYVPERDTTNWNERKIAVSESLEELSADILLFQEMETFERGHAPQQNIQLQWVLKTLPEYTAGAIGDPQQFPVTQPVLFKTSRFELIDQGFFFFSETPDIIYSEPWEGRWPAYTTWVLLSQQDGSTFYVFNTHLDAFSKENRDKGSDLILERILTRSNKISPVILAGDFNSFASSPIMELFSNSGFAIAPTRGSSFHFGIGLNLYPAIDHILYSHELELVESGIVQRKWSGHWPSDHYPVYGSFRYNR